MKKNPVKINYKEQHTTTYKEKINLPNSSLTFADLHPVLEKYSIKARPYKTTRKLIGKGLTGWLKTALRAFASGKKSGFQLGLLMFYLLIVGPVLALNNYPSLTTTIFVLILTIYLTLRAIAKITFKRFKVDLIQALFLDNGIATSVNPKGYITKEQFNSTNFFANATLLDGEDFVQGSTSQFHFVFSELRARGNLSWLGFEDIFEGLYFYGTWSRPPLDSNFRIRQRDLSSFMSDISAQTFDKCFEVVDREGNPAADSSVMDSIPYEFKNNLINILNKYDCQLELIYQEGQVLLLLAGRRDYFPLSFDNQINDKEVFKKIAEDVLFISDLIGVLGGLKKDNR